MGGEIHPDEVGRILRVSQQEREHRLQRELDNVALKVRMLIQAIDGEDEKTRKRILRRFNKLVGIAKTVTEYEDKSETPYVWPVEGRARKRAQKAVWPGTERH